MCPVDTRGYGSLTPGRSNHAEQVLVEGPDKIQHTTDAGTISIGWHCKRPCCGAF